MKEGIIPPNDLGAEGVLLAAILAGKPGAVDDIGATLRPEHFYSGRHSKIFQAALDLHANGDGVDITTVASRLRDRREIEGVGGYPYLREVLSLADSFQNLDVLARVVHDKWRVREMIRHARTIEDEGLTGFKEETGAWIERNIGSITGVAAAGLDDTSELIGDVARSAIANVERALSEGRPSGKPSGFSRYDAWTGGLHAGELTILAARPGVGKSSFAGQLARNMASPSSATIVFSMEMSREQWVHRLLAAESEVDASKFRLASMNPAEVARVRKASADMGSLLLHIDDKVGLTLVELRSKIRRVQANECVSLVVVDYLQLMRGPDSSETREREIATLAQGLKEAAKDLGVPILALSQLNRAVEQRASGVPLLSDLRESGAIEQAADNVVFLLQGPNEGQLVINIAKQRSGPVGSVDLRFDKRFLRFSEV